VAPLRLGGRRGKQSTSRVWLGGTGERSTVGEQERRGSKGQGTERRTSSEAGEWLRYDLNLANCLFRVRLMVLIVLLEKKKKKLVPGNCFNGCNLRCLHENLLCELHSEFR
jgi:hypothetical protein